jgi:hypothetical protein
MSEFDREDLKAAFEVANIPASNDYITRLDSLLYALAQRYRFLKISRQQDLNRQLTTLEQSRKVLGSLRDSDAVSYVFDSETRAVISRLATAVESKVSFLKSEKNNEECARMIPKRSYLWICVISMSG